MSVAEEVVRKRSQGIDYIGKINQMLRDLEGDEILAYELIQNADDAKASVIRFDVTDQALIVDNDARFSDCDDDGEECVWEQEGKHRCDFHRFQKIAGADKRIEEGTTGAFGVGFLSVYQITNRPQIYSGKRHWSIFIDRSEAERIDERLLNPPYSETRLILPWANQENCPLRRRLGAPQITAARVQSLFQKFCDVAGQAILFSRNVQRIEVYRNGQLEHWVNRAQEGKKVTILANGEPQVWMLYAGNFEQEAGRLRSEYPDSIEQKKGAGVVVAIPIEQPDFRGRYYATLPTQDFSGAPFHVNADFYPESNRKHIKFDETGYAGCWNNSAVSTAARILAAALPELPELMGYQALWQLLEQVSKLQNETKTGRRAETVMASFWEFIKPVARKTPIVYSTRETWHLPNETRYLLNVDNEKASLPILEDLGIPIANIELNTHQNIFREIEVGQLSAFDVASAMVRIGLTDTMKFSDAPFWLQDQNLHTILSKQIEILLSRVNQRKDEAAEKLAECAIALAADGDFTPPSCLFRADAKQIGIFEPFALKADFLALNNPPAISELATALNVAGGVSHLLEDIKRDFYQSIWETNPDALSELILWMEDSSEEINRNPALRDKIRSLPLWASSSNICTSLTDLVVPGTFDDHLGLTDTVHERIVGLSRPFLTGILKAPTLTFVHYASHSVPEYFRSSPSADTDKCQRLVKGLAKHRDEITSNNEALRWLAECPFITCCDGSLKAANSVYFNEPAVQAIDTPKSVVVKLADGDEPVRAFYEWLGVSRIPRPPDVIKYIEKATSNPPTATTRRFVATLFHELGKFWNIYTDQQKEDFSDLKSKAWLPASDKQEQWYIPSEIFTTYQFFLFETTGIFLDLDLQQQRQANELIRFLEIRTEPDCPQVVEHLLNNAKSGDAVNREVYRFLGDEKRLEDRSLERLKTEPCILLDSGEYVEPHKVFWNSHPFQPYLHYLSGELDEYRRLFNRLGVKDVPSVYDVISLLVTIGKNQANKRLNDQTFSVVIECWKMLNASLSRDDALLNNFRNRLNGEKVVPDQDRYLNAPHSLFIEDIPNLRSKFGSLFERYIIERNEGIWLAMEATGVRRLSRVIQRLLVDCDNPRSAYDIIDRIKERRLLIKRILQADNIQDWDEPLLDKIGILRCDLLQIGYSTTAFNKVQNSPPERQEAFYKSEDETLYVEYDADIPWLDIARELSSALCSEREYGDIAARIALVMEAGTFQDGNKKLDKLNLPPLAAIPETISEFASPVGLGGQETDIDDYIRDMGYSEDIPSDEAQTFKDINQEAESEEDDFPSSDASPKNSKYSDSDSTNSRAKRNSNEQNSEEANGERSQGEKQRNSGRERSDNGTKNNSSTANTSRQGMILRSYVYSTGTGTEMRQETLEHRTAVDSKGVEKVLAAERKAGRHPTEMPHTHPGYDVESLNMRGQVERYIEIKSISSYWETQAVGLSEKQFETAVKFGAKFWLYVVEWADDDSAYRILRIQDPASRVNKFMFDDGWRILDEELEPNHSADII